jgi:uncharacterized membrane protein YphA (DoxX/SURF4 family)
MNKVLNILCILAGLAMVIFGLDKFLQFMPRPELTEEQKTIFGAFMTLKWLMPLTAIGEIVGGALLAWPKTRALGAIVLFPIVLGIMAHHLTFDPSSIAIGGVFFAIVLWAIFSNKDRYMQMIK